MEQAFILLLRAGLWQRDIEDITPFPLSSQEWDELFCLSRKQTVQGIVFKGLNKLPVRLLPSQKMIWTWMVEAAGIEECFRQATTAAAASHALLKRVGAEVILQKGLAIARFYDEPQIRVNGDIDWYVRQPADIRGIVKQITDTVSELQFHADGSYSLVVKETEIELHPQLTDLLSSRARRCVESLLNEEGTEQMTLADGTAVNIPGPMTTLLMLTSHIMKHVCTVGIGLRQFCDVARAYYALHGHYDVERLRNIYRQVRIIRWSTLLDAFLSEVLGTSSEVLPTCKNPDTQQSTSNDIQHLLREVMRGGNFGQHTVAWQEKAENREGTTWHTIRSIVRQLPFSLRYAPRETMLHTYTLINNKYKTITS